MWEIHMLGLMRRELETGLRAPRQLPTLPYEGLSTNAEHGGGSSSSSDEVSVMEMERRG